MRARLVVSSAALLGFACSASSTPSSADPSAPARLAKFSFFVTSLQSIRAVSGSDDGFGGDLRFGETGEGAGLRGADAICRRVAERGMEGAGSKDWRAFLSTTSGGPDGAPVHAKTRIGSGPWYDAVGRLVAASLDDLLEPDRPAGADPAIANDLPNELGVPNHQADAPGCAGSGCPDNHQILTGTNCAGELYTGGALGVTMYRVQNTCRGTTVLNLTPNLDYTCNDWTSKEPSGAPWCGHSWPRITSGNSWMSAANDGGCAPCVALVESGGVDPSDPSHACVGAAGGYGGFYCFEYRP
jgi:hypothetical protein